MPEGHNVQHKKPQAYVNSLASVKEPVMAKECVVCGNDGFPIFQVEDATIYKCKTCHLEFADPMPSDAQLETLYSDYIYYTEYDQKMIRDTVIKNNRIKIEFLGGYGLNKNHRLIDFGCGDNLFVPEGGSDSWVGYDYPQDEQSALLKTKYDFITSWGVLEHVPDPMKIVGILSTLLDKGGKLAMITVGTETGIPYRYRYPIHLTWWSKKSVEELLERTGFKVLEISNYFMLQNPQFYLDRVLDRGQVPKDIREKISINIEDYILVPTNEIVIVAEKL